MFLVRIQSLLVVALLATPSLALSGDGSFTEDLSKKKAAGAFATSGSAGVPTCRRAGFV